MRPRTRTVPLKPGWSTVRIIESKVRGNQYGTWLIQTVEFLSGPNKGKRVKQRFLMVPR